MAGPGHPRIAWVRGWHRREQIEDMPDAVYAAASGRSTLEPSSLADEPLADESKFKSDESSLMTKPCRIHVLICSSPDSDSLSIMTGSESKKS